MKTPSSRRSADDRGFRLGTGFFALLVVLLVAGIFWELYRTSHLSIAKFGFRFWTGKTWDPVSGEFGALPFIWGTLYSSLLAMLISTPIALGIADLSVGALAPAPPDTARLPDGAARGHPVDRLRPLGGLRARPHRASAPGRDARLAEEDPALLGAAARRRHGRGGAHPRGHGHPVHVVGGARGPQARCPPRSARRPTRSARPAGRRSRRPCASAAPGSSAPSSSGSAARSARRWPSRWSSATTRRSPRRSSRRSTRWPPSSPTSSPRRPTISTSPRSSRSASCSS